MLKVLELFGGIGACSKALERLNIEHEIVDYVEIDKYAVKSFNAIHNTNFEPQDITTWDKDIDVDLIMHGSPCQDFSLAGKQAGGDKDSGTRSSLLYETIRIVSKLKPKYVIWENVKNVISKKHKHIFNDYLDKMKQLGYTNYYQVLNAKDYGIPQNRERVFTISIRNDFDKNGIEILNVFKFPLKQELKLKLKNMLEDEVEEKYYLSDKAINGRINTNYEKYKLEENIVNNKEIHPTILSRSNGAPTLLKVLGTYQYAKSDMFMKGKDRFQENKEIVDTIQTFPKEGVVLIPEATKKGYKEAYNGDGVYINRPHQKRGCVQSQMIQTIKTGCDIGVIDNLRIRKLTPKECWRLMGFDDEDFDKASKVNSNAQLYKQAGNSIVVNVLEEIFKELL